jgi:hypothetical protein
MWHPLHIGIPAFFVKVQTLIVGVLGFLLWVDSATVDGWYSYGVKVILP